MASKKKIEVDVDIEINSEPSLKQLRELKKQLKETAAGSAEFNKLVAQIRDVEDALEESKVGAEDWAGSLEKAGGPLGLLGKGIRQAEITFSSFNTALKASVIGLVVAAIGGLVAAFSQSEAAQKKLQPIFIAFEKILGGIFRAMEPLLDIFIELAMTALPYITKGIGMFYSGLFGLFTFIKNVGQGVINILKGIFTLDFEQAQVGFDQLKNSVSDAAGAAQEAYKRFTDGTKELTKTEKEELEKRNAAKKANQDEQDKRNKEALEKQKKNLDAQIQLEVNKDNTSKENLKKLLDERMRLEMAGQNMTEAEKELLRQDYAKKLDDALKEDENKRQENEKKKLERRSRELDALIQLEIDKTNTSTAELQTLLDQRMNIELQNVELTEAEKNVIRAKYAKQLADAIKADEDKRKKDRQDALANELAVVSNDIDRQLELYQQFQAEILASEQYTAGEKLRIIGETNQKILGLQQQRFAEERLQNEINAQEGDLTQIELLNKEKGILDQEFAFFKDLFDKKKITEIQYLQFVKANNQAQMNVDKSLLDAKMANFQAVSQLLSATASLVGEQTKAGKALAIASATIDTYVSANKVLADPTPMPTVLRFALAAAAIVRGLVSVKKIVDTKLPVSGGGTAGSPGGQPANQPPGLINVSARKMAQGGFVSGPGTSTSDSIPALLSDGEFVVNARSTQLFKPLLTAINDAGALPQFAVGGMVKGQNQPQQDNSARIAEVIQQTFQNQPIRTFVTATDISNQQQFDRVIKSRSLI
jgi:hypothetical protein